MIQALIAFFAFIILSFVVRAVADRQITVRSGRIAAFGYSDEVRVQREAEFASAMEKIKSTKALILIMCILAVPAALLFLTDNPMPVKIEYALFLLLTVNIAVVDFLVKRIPNELILSLLIVRALFIVYSMFSSGSFNGEVLKADAFSSVVGLALALMIFVVPSFFHVYIGAGDVKYCAAIGFCFGFMGFIEVSFVMGLALFIVLVYLRVTKKGSIKSKVALGPYLTLGAIAHMLLNLISLLTA